GEPFETKSEIETLVALYRKHGAEFVKMLRGMFAILIYDNVENVLIAARDMFGIKPLYYRKTGTGFIFSSELKAFEFDSSYDGFKVDKTLLQHYFTFQYVTEPDTICGDIGIVKKGSYVVCHDDAETHVYYEQSFAPDVKTSYEVKKKKLRDTVEKSVAYHMLSDVPLGSFLSRGIDSAVITAVASKLEPGIKAFTVGFNVRGFSELNDAAQISEHLDIDHIKLECDLQDFIDNYEKTIYHLDSPVADPSVVAIYLIAREAAKHVKVVLSGEGSDELFAGYRVYASAIPASKIYALPGFVKLMLSGIAKILPGNMKGKSLIQRGLTPVSERFVGNSFVFDEKSKKQILKTFDPSVRYTDRTKAIYDFAQPYSDVMKMQYCDLQTWLPSDILVKGDRLSMASSLEVRVPFLDSEVFAAARELADTDKITNKTTKYILRDAFSDLLNKETIVRPKLGYPVPVKVWLKDELYDWAKEIITSEYGSEYIDTEGALKLLERHRKGKEDLYHQIWSVLVFKTWHKLYIDEIEDTKKRVLNGEL
ncbi:MAG: asparagine synthase (glutamine-hydrolyzing), partial [Clostridia bacterium]|nr:asparagine synthase (glutamine-hydrolyzing) [Clostridia bacterium]